MKEVKRYGCGYIFSLIRQSDLKLSVQQTFDRLDCQSMCFCLILSISFYFPSHVLDFNP